MLSRLRNRRRARRVANHRELADIDAWLKAIKTAGVPRRQTEEPL